MINNKNPLPLITYKRNPKCKKTVLWYIKNNQKKKKLMHGGNSTLKAIGGLFLVLIISIISLYIHGLFIKTNSGAIAVPLFIIFTINFIYSLINKYIGKYLKSSNVSKKNTVEDVRYVKKEIKKLILSIPDIVPIFNKLPKHKKNSQPFKTFREFIQTFKIPEIEDEFQIKINLPTVEVPFLHPLNAACCGFLRFSELIMGVIDDYLKPLAIKVMNVFKPVKEFIEKLYNKIKKVLKKLEDLKDKLITWLFNKVDIIVGVIDSVPLISELLAPLTNGIAAEKLLRQQQVLETARKREIRNADMLREKQKMERKMNLAKSDASTKTSVNYKKMSGGGVNYYDSIKNSLKSIDKVANLQYRKKCYKIMIMYKKDILNLKKKYKKKKRKKCLNNKCVMLFKKLYICVDNLKKETANLQKQTNNIINIQNHMKGGGGSLRGGIDWGDIVDAATSIGNALKDAANKVGEAAMDGYNAAKDQAEKWASEAAKAAKAAFLLAKQKVVAAIAEIERVIKEIFDLGAILGKITEMGTTIAGLPALIKTKMSDIFNKIADISNKVGDAIKKFPIIGNLIKQIGKLIKWFLTDIIGRGINVIDAIVALVNELTSSIPLPSWLSKDNPIMKLPPILDILEAIVKIPAKEFFETTWDNIKETFEAFNMDWLDDLVNTFKAGIEELVKVAKDAYNAVAVPALKAAELALKIAEGVCKAATFGQASCSFAITFSDETESRKEKLGYGDIKKIDLTPKGPWIKDVFYNTTQGEYAWFVTEGDYLDLDILWEDSSSSEKPRTPYVKTTGKPRIIVGELKKQDGTYNKSKHEMAFHNTTFRNDNGNFAIEKQIWSKGESYIPPGKWTEHCDRFWTTFDGNTLTARLVKPIKDNEKWKALMTTVRDATHDDGQKKFPTIRNQEDECARLFKEQKGVFTEFEYDSIRISDQDDKIDYDWKTGKFKLNQRRVPWIPHPGHHRPFGKWHEKAHRDASSANGRIPLNGTHLRAFIYNKENKLVYQSINIEHIYDEFEVNEKRELYCSWRHPHNEVEFWNAQRRTKDRPGPPDGVGWDDPNWVSRGRGPDEDKPL